MDFNEENYEYVCPTLPHVAKELEVLTPAEREVIRRVVERDQELRDKHAARLLLVYKPNFNGHSD